MHTQKDKSLTFLTREVLGRKRIPYYQERDKNPSATIQSFPSQGLPLWENWEKKVDRAYGAGECSVCMQVRGCTWDSSHSRWKVQGNWW